MVVHLNIEAVKESSHVFYFVFPLNSEVRQFKSALTMKAKTNKQFTENVTSERMLTSSLSN